jgi:uncharacterized membrane protein
MSKGLRITLIVSLALNCVLLGVGLTMGAYHFLGVPHRGFMFIAGPGGAGAGPGGRGGFGPTPGLIMSALDPDTRKKVGEILDANRAEMRASFEAAIAARQETVKALSAETFSAEALEAAFAKSRDADLKALEEGHKVAVKIVSSLTPAERAKVAKAIAEGRPRFFNKRLRHGWGMGGFGARGSGPDSDDGPDVVMPAPPPADGAAPGEGPPPQP